MLASLYHILQLNFYLNKLKSWNKIKLTADFSFLITVSNLSFLLYQNLLKCYCRKKRYNVIGAPYCISEMKAPPCGIKTAVVLYLHNTSSENGWCQSINTNPWSASLLPPWKVKIQSGVAYLTLDECLKVTSTQSQHDSHRSDEQHRLITLYISTLIKSMHILDIILI